MSLFANENDAKYFKAKIVEYLTYKKNEDIKSVVLSAKMEEEYLHHDRWERGFDVSKLIMYLSIKVSYLRSCM